MTLRPDSPNSKQRKAKTSRSLNPKFPMKNLESELKVSESREKHPSDETYDSALYGELARSPLYVVLVEAPGMCIHNVLDKWVEEGNALDRHETHLVINRLRRARMDLRALQFSLWLEGYKNYDFIEVDYCRRLHMISRIYSIEKAREYIKRIPESFRGELIYTALLSIYVQYNRVKEAEEVFGEMRSLRLPLTVAACNQLLIVYRRNQKPKMKDVLLLMEREDVKPSILTYTLLIDAIGESNNLARMERILESMTSEGIEPDDDIRILLAKHYASAGLKDKAKALLKETKEDNTHTRRSLLRIYGDFGEADEVRRIWKACGPNPQMGDYFEAIAAWGRLNEIEEAEAAFERMLKASKRTSAVLFILLLKVYVDRKMSEKGKELVKLMVGSGCRIGPWTWDLVVRLYAGAGEIEKADAALHRAAREFAWFKPKISSYMAVMNQYSIRGDVHNAEKIFLRIGEAGHSRRYPQFQALVLAYVNAKKPVYGIWDRMKADNFYPNKTLAEQLVLVDAFSKTSTNNSV